MPLFWYIVYITLAAGPFFNGETETPVKKNPLVKKNDQKSLVSFRFVVKFLHILKVSFRKENYFQMV